MKISEIIREAYSGAKGTITRMDERTPEEAIRGGLDRGEIGWAVRDVRPGYLNHLTNRQNWRQWTEIIKSKDWRIVDLPIRWLIASQHNVNSDFQIAALVKALEPDDNKYPVVVKKSGKLIVTDGHHRVAYAAYEGRQTIRVRYINLDGPHAEPTSLF